MAFIRSFAITLSMLALAACSGDDGGGNGTVDAPSGGIDAANACVLSSTVVTCTPGNNAPCTAVCGNAYCYTFNQLATPNVCTQPCTAGSTDQCPTGWSCNNMGRCRPPG